MRAIRRSFVFLALAACAGGPPRPQAIPLDRFNCARCGMMISSERGDAQVLYAGRDPRFYDDIGCLAADRAAWQNGGVPYVMTEADGWARADAAFYARPADSHTAMNYGFTAHAVAAEATRADREGKSLRWGDVLNAAAAQVKS
jgi:copper chaperone NosL